MRKYFSRSVIVRNVWRNYHVRITVTQSLDIRFHVLRFVMVIPVDLSEILALCQVYPCIYCGTPPTVFFAYQANRVRVLICIFTRNFCSIIFRTVIYDNNVKLVQHTRFNKRIYSFAQRSCDVIRCYRNR